MTMPIDVSEKAGVRYLHFGSSWIQGAMRIARPWSLELEYTREMMAALLLRTVARWPRNVLLIGLGAGSLTKFLYRHRPQAKLQVVEIEPGVVAAARQCFRLPEDARRVAIAIGDGDEYVAVTARTFDLMLVDGFDAGGRAGALDTERFYRRARSRLSDTGLMVVNLLGRSRGYKVSMERICSAFDQRAIAMPSCDSGNVIVFAAAGDTISMPFPELRTAAGKLRRDTGLNLLPTLARLTATQAGQGDRLEL